VTNNICWPCFCTTCWTLTFSHIEFDIKKWNVSKFFLKLRDLNWNLKGRLISITQKRIFPLQVHPLQQTMPESFQNSTDSNQSGKRLFVFNPFHIDLILGNLAGIYSAFTEPDFSNHNWSKAAWNSNYALFSHPTQQKSSIKSFINGTNQIWH